MHYRKEPLILDFSSVIKMTGNLWQINDYKTSMKPFELCSGYG